MSDFISTGLNKKIDHLMDVLYGSGVSAHHTIIEQINYLMFLRALSKRDEESELLNPKHEDIVLKGELSKYRWDNLLRLNAETLFNSLEEAYKDIPQKSDNTTIRLLYHDAHVKIYNKPTLRTLVHELEALSKELDEISHDGRHDIFGDMYEYLLSKLSSAGSTGQFRTPRHIIKFMVDVIDPKKGETILDPACGTAGFLVAAYKHLASKYTSQKFLDDGSFAMDKLSPQERDFLYKHTFSGFDSSDDMIKFGLMNLHLHGLGQANLKRQNTLVDTAGDRIKWDVILANPPFSGKLDRESVSEDLQMGTGSTEILFLRYMVDHLSPEGKLAVIVPEGVLFGSSTAHKKIREIMLDNGLWAVVSLPAGVFNPYAGVKTSIVFLDKSKKANDEVKFYEVESDGFDLSANRRPIDNNDLIEAMKCLGDSKAVSEKFWSAKKTEITENNFVLSSNSYKPASINNERFREPKEILDEIDSLKKETDEIESQIKTLIQ